jgi:hypothetical protein
MSYGGVENAPEDLEILVGATITSIRIVPADEMEERLWSEMEGTISREDFDRYSDKLDAIEFTVRYRDKFVVVDDQGEHTEGRFQVWQDVEGNGPGYIAYLGA